jgi:ribose transport system substrate-binding protein
MIALVSLVLAACTAAAGPNTGDAAKKISVVTPYMANETTKYVIDQFKEQAEAKGWEVTVTDTAGDFGMLVSRIQDAVTQNVDAVVLGMGDPTQMTAGLDAAQKAGIPVFGLDAGVTEGVLLNVTSDNAALGKASAEALAEAIGETGNVIMFTHDPHPGVRERAAAAEAALSQYPNINIVQKIHIDVPGPLDNARSNTEDQLSAYAETGSIAGIWAGWDEPAAGAVQAIEAAGRSEIKVVGIDGAPFALEEIAKNGPFIATVAQDFDGMAQQLVDQIEKSFNGEAPASDSIRIPGVLVTQDNVK